MQTPTALQPGETHDMSKPRVLLADDHSLLLEAFQKLLADECEIVGVATNGRALVTAAATLRPDVIVVDVTMPLLNGIDAARQIKQTDSDVRIIFLTMNEDPNLAAEAFRAGASGYLLKRSAASELVTAIREVVKHRSYITPLVAEGLVGSMLHGLEIRPTTLTPRQREIVHLEHRPADRRVSQVPHHGAITSEDNRGADSVRDQKPHCLITADRVLLGSYVSRPLAFAVGLS
jgi:DNA-binding NarL/FixJ family response regulator